MSAVCFCPSSLLYASDVGSSSTLIGYRGEAPRVGALKVHISELRALVHWARYCVYVRNYVRLPRLKAAACFSVGVTLLRKIYSKQFMLPFRLRVLPSNLPPEQ